MFSAWLGSLHSFCCARLTLVFWDRTSRVLWDTLADESISPRQTDGELLVLMCLRHGTAQKETAGRGALRFAQLLELSSVPVDQADQVVPTDYFNGLVASAAGRLPQPPQPLSAGDLADLWDSLWLLLMAAADGKLSENRMSGTARTN